MKGYSQKALGKRVGKSGGTIWRWEKGVTKPSAEDMEALTTALEVNVRELYRKPDPDEPLQPEGRDPEQPDLNRYNRLEEKMDLMERRMEKMNNEMNLLIKYCGHRNSCPD